LEIQCYFDTRNFDLVPLDRVFNDRWLNKTFKRPDIRKEIDAAVSDIYANIKVLERIPDYGATAKTLYLETLDMGAALKQVDTMKANAEKLAREQAEREDRERREQIERNRKALEQEKEESVPPSERMNELVNEALDIPMPEVETPQKPEIMEFTLRFRGTKEKLFALKAWMNDNGIAYEKIG
jgi:F0F1-type ATP synthase membrane subunit b/b'